MRRPENISLISVLKTLSNISEKGGAVSHHLAESFAMVNRETEPGMVEHFRALAAFQMDDLKSTLLFIERSLRAEIGNAELFCRNKNLTYKVALRIESIGLEHPSDFQFLENYESLLSLGEVSLECHLCAARGFFLTGNISRAKDIASKLLKAVPQFPGLKELTEKIEEKVIDG